MTTVLVVDDEPMVRDVVSRYLERDGHRVVTAEDGEAARGLIESEAPSLVLLDVMLPGRTDGLELGPDDYVTKPFSPRELATRVRTVLRRARPSRPPIERVSVGPLEIDAAKR